jgi:predicted TPR repeat methyltransferase
MRCVLGDGGQFAFSVEALDAGDYALQPSGRYAHSQSYLEALAQAYGFRIDSITAQVLRQDEGGDVQGLIALFSLPRVGSEGVP